MLRWAELSTDTHRQHHHPYNIISGATYRVVFNAAFSQRSCRLRGQLQEPKLEENSVLIRHVWESLILGNYKLNCMVYRQYLLFVRVKMGSYLLCDAPLYKYDIWSLDASIQFIVPVAIRVPLEHVAQLGSVCAWRRPVLWIEGVGRASILLLRSRMIGGVLQSPSQPLSHLWHRCRKGWDTVSVLLQLCLFFVPVHNSSISDELENDQIVYLNCNALHATPAPKYSHMHAHT